MKKISSPIVFFGSGPVAAQSLSLLSERVTIEAVITKPRPPHHKGSVPVIDTAKRLGLPLHTASDKTELATLCEASNFSSKVGVLIDFGIIVPKKVIDYFSLGIINSHFSILPQWRGADPITFSILSGQQETGVSLMLLVPAMDEGPLLRVGHFPLPPDITTPLLTAKLIELSNSLLIRTLPEYITGKVIPVAQESTGKAISYSRKLTKDDGVLNWQKPAHVLEREIRAYIDWPKSHTQLAGKQVIITKAHVVPGNTVEAKPGDIETSLIGDGILMIETIDGRLCIDRLKPAGKREMSTREFLAGNRLT